MVRVKRGKLAKKRKKKILKQVKGYKWGRKNLIKRAKEALLKAWSYAYRDRKIKKREFRKLWQIQISAFCKKNGISYSKFMGALKKKNINLNRKILAILAKDYPEIFERIIKEAKEQK